MPPPRICAEYEQLNPGFTSRLESDVRRESDHRRKTETRGQFMAYTLAAGGICGAIACILLGHDLAGVGLGGIDIAGIVALFLYRNRHSPVSGDKTGEG